MILRPGHQLIDKPVISLDEGRFLGNLKGLYLDAKLNRVEGLFMGRKGLLKRKDQLIPIESVAILGIDAILIKKSSALTDEEAYPAAREWLRLAKLQGREVDTPGGTRVGVIGDVLLTDQTKIAGFGLAKIFVEGPIKENRGVMRSAVVDAGNLDGVMTVNLERAELDRPDSPHPPTKETEE